MEVRDLQGLREEGLSPGSHHAVEAGRGTRASKSSTALPCLQCAEERQAPCRLHARERVPDMSLEIVRKAAHDTIAQLARMGLIDAKEGSHV